VEGGSLEGAVLATETGNVGQRRRDVDVTGRYISVSELNVTSGMNYDVPVATGDGVRPQRRGECEEK
jgi:hypothetical protein